MINNRVHECHIAYAVEVKFPNNRYMTPITIKFDTIESKFTVNVTFKYCRIFAAIKIVDPSASIITDNDTIINRQDAFSYTR